MVGVPGKSKGCSTCRRRKKGCDQKRPVCGQCSASGYLCGGYERELTFVLHPASKTVEKAVFLPTKPRPLSLAAPSLERSAIVSQCQNVFFDIYLPHGRCVVTDPFILKCGRHADWTTIMRTLVPSETSLELAFAAFSTSRVGRNQNDPRLIKESTKFYGKALKTLQKALYDPSRMYSEQVLTACLLLGLYESFEGAGGKSVSWVSHAQGAARIVELRGPEQHAEPPGHTLFLGTRLPITYAAILRRRKTFLNNEEWLTIPWRSHIKSGLDRLIDVITHVPNLLEQFDTARSQLSSTGQREALQSCLSLCQSLQKSLATWNTIRRPNSEPIPIEHIPLGPSDSYPFTQELTFENFLFLNANLVLWTAGLVISTTMSEIEFLQASFGFQSPSTFSINADAVEKARECAESIAQSIPYCLWPDMGDIGIDYIQFPMCLAFQFFMKSNNSRACSWILEKARDMQKNDISNMLNTDRSSTGYVDGELGLGIFGASAFNSQTNAVQLQSMTGSSMDAAFASIPVSRSGNEMGLNYNTLGIGTTKSNNKTVTPVTAILGTDLDCGYNFRNDHETRILEPSTIATPAVSSSNYSEKSYGLKVLLTDTPPGSIDEFTFVQENPARYYVDRSEIDVR